MFPSLFLYPTGVAPGLYFQIVFNVNRTLEDYEHELLAYAEITTTVLNDIGSLHNHTSAFLEVQVRGRGRVGVGRHFFTHVAERSSASVVRDGITYAVLTDGIAVRVISSRCCFALIAAAVTHLCC